MKLIQKDLNALCLIAKEAAVKAGVMIASNLSNDPERQQIQINNKNSGSSKASQVVTEVDLKSEKIILEILNPTLAQYDIALLSEESTDDLSRFEKDYFWCIDPLDGTLAFTESKPGFSVSIALVSKNGKPQIGVVYDPSTQRLYSAIKGQGVFKNERKWRERTKTEVYGSVNQKKTSDNSKVLTIIAESNLIKSDAFQVIKDKLKYFVKAQGWQGIKVMEGAGAVLNACQVIENSPAVYFKLPKPAEGGGSTWDFAATCAIFEAHRASVSDIFGELLALNKEGVTFMNHCGVIYASKQNILTEITKIHSQFINKNNEQV